MTKSIKSKDVVSIFAMTTLILTIPLIAMRSSKVGDWDLADFVIMAALLVLAGLAIVYASRKISKANVRLAIIVAIVITFVLTWGELGVGIFGTPFAGN